MSAVKFYRCPYCKRQDFSSQRGLTQHQRASKSCFAKATAKFGATKQTSIAHSFLKSAPVHVTNGQVIDNYIRREYANIRHEDALARQQIEQDLAESPTKLPRLDDTNPEAWQMDSFSVNLDDSDDSFDLYSDDYNVSDDIGLALDQNGNGQDEIPRDNDQLTTLLDAYQTYCRDKREHLVRFTQKECIAIDLLLALRHTKASLDTYETVMTWHLKATNQMPPTGKLTHATAYVSRQKLFRKLEQRYKLTPEPSIFTQCLTLPHSKARPNIVCNSAKEQMISLLTDPRIQDEDYLFWENNPFACPPESPEFLGDLNTGQAYIQTHRALIQNPGKQVLLPVIFYIDAANTGQFSDLPITAVKFSLGIFTRKAREKEHMWRILGYLPEISKHKSRGRRLFLDSQHVDSTMEHHDAMEGEGDIHDDNVPKAQDMHTMLDVILASYVKLQNEGFIWDLKYQGAVFRNVEFVLFTPFLKVDTEEADKLCGKYTSRGVNVAQLCRYCECPNRHTDKCLAHYPAKNKVKISQLVNSGDVEALKALSQQNIRNAFYKIRFGSHNNQEIHGACPLEMLHALLLGTFRYARDCFFEQMGPTSQLAADVNAYARLYGDLLRRQSDRDIPKTNFNKGIKKGKLMAKEYPGILLCMAAVLVSKAGRARLARKDGFKQKNQASVQDWILLVETLLQWEAWLKQDKLQRKHVVESEQYHRYIMYIIKTTGKRKAGMGLKILKFHAIMHMTTDILNFGVPMEYDTGANEAGHKATKKAAKLTQKCEETFDRQTAERLNEIHLLEMAEQEIMGNSLWRYGHYTHAPVKQIAKQDSSVLTGATIGVRQLDGDGLLQAFMITRSTGSQTVSLESDFVEFVAELQQLVKPFSGYVQIRTELRRNDTIFRASPQYRNAVWRDWVLIDWGEEEGELPAKLWGFVDLSGIALDHGLNHGSCDLEPTVYAIVESSGFYQKEGDLRSELFYRIRKEVGGFTHNLVSHLKFYMVDVESFVRPLVVVPDVGGATNEYFVMRERAKWACDFERWLEDQEFQFGIEEEYEYAAPGHEPEEPEEEGEELSESTSAEGDSIGHSSTTDEDNPVSNEDDAASAESI